MKPMFGINVVETYLDNAATTQLDPDVFDEMMPFMDSRFGNPDSNYHLGFDAKEAVEKSQERVAELLGVSTGRVFFTSGGTESNNWTIKSIGQRTYGGKLGRVVCTAVEHSSVLRPVKWLETMGCETGTVGVDKASLVKIDEYKELIKDSKLVCVQYANNETGTIQDIKELARLAHEAGALIHVDAVQAFGKIPVFPIDLDIDTMSVSAHKIHGPKGIGALYIREGLSLEPLIHGGGPDVMRGGTLPVHQIVGFGAAAEKSRCTISVEAARQADLTEWAEVELAERVEAMRNGSSTSCLPNILNMRFKEVDGTVLAAVLNKQFGICVSTGAACSRGAPSHVLKAMGLNTSEVAASLRISIGRMTTENQVRYLVASMQAAMKMARDKSTI